MANKKFPGFPLGLLHFLGDLSKHNNRTWFTAKPYMAFLCRVIGVKF